ncbi:MAG TPA: DMT family transporter [Thermoanaerobaculia bacterium]
MNSRRTRAIASAIGLMVVWGSTFAITKASVVEIPPLALSALRFLIAAAVLIPIVMARGGLANIPRPLPLGPLALMALTGVAIFHVGFNYALLYGSASQGAIVFALVPAAIALAAVTFLRERPSPRRIAGMVLSFAGVALVVAAGRGGAASPNPLLGALWMLLGVAAWAIYTVVAKRLAGMDQVVVIAGTSAIGAAMLIPAAIVELWNRPLPNPTPRGWLGALFLGVVASAIAFVVYSRILRELEASLVGVFMNLDPIVGVLVAVLFLGETLTPRQIIGGVIAVAGMWLSAAEG